LIKAVFEAKLFLELQAW